MNDKEFPRTWIATLVRIKQRKYCVRFGILYARSLYRAGLLTAAARILLRYKLILWVCRSLHGTTWTGLGHGIIIFSAEKEKKIIKYERGILYTTEEYHQLRKYTLLTIGYHI